MFKKLININYLFVFLCVIGLGIFIYNDHKEKVEMKLQNDKLFEELLNVKLRINKHALEIQGVKSIIDSTGMISSGESFMIAEEIVNTANRYNTVSVSLLTSVIHNESLFEKYAENDKSGAEGLGQLMPETVAWICNDWNMNCVDSTVYDLQFNIRATAWYLDWLYKNPKVCRLDKERTLAYYNGGGRQAYRWGLYRKKLDGLKLDEEESKYLKKLAKETREYVSDVMRNDSLFKKIIDNQVPLG